MRKMKTLVLASGLALAAVAGSASASYGYNNGYNSAYDNGYNSGNGYGRTVRCESRDSRTVYCGADASSGVRLVQQLSRSACIRGRTWGADGRGIWVARGCRGTFAINDRIDDRYGSRNGYGSGYNNGYDNYSNGGYNNGGYSNGGYSNGGYNNGYGSNRGYSNQSVRCESTDGRTRVCGIDTRNGLRIVSQRSHQPCIQGSTWGASGNGVWVTDGCRADFATGSSQYGYNRDGYDRRY